MVSPGGVRTAGEVYTPEELASFLNRRASILALNEGGVTFSGGEPLAQARFIAEVIDRLEDCTFCWTPLALGRKRTCCFF